MPRIRKRSRTPSEVEAGDTSTPKRTRTLSANRVRTRRTRTNTTSFNEAQFKELEAKVQHLGKVEDDLDKLVADRKTTLKDIETSFVDMFGEGACEARNIGSYYLGNSEEMGKASSTIATKDYLAILQDLHGEEEGMEVFLESISVTKAAASKHLTSAALTKVTKTQQAESKGVKFSIKRSKAKVS